MISGGDDVIIEIKCTMSVMLVKHPETIPLPIPPWSLEKLSSTKLVPGAKKVEDHCYRLFLAQQPDGSLRNWSYAVSLSSKPCQGPPLTRVNPKPLYWPIKLYMTQLQLALWTFLLPSSSSLIALSTLASLLVPELAQHTSPWGIFPFTAPST